MAWGSCTTRAAESHDKSWSVGPAPAWVKLLLSPPHAALPAGQISDGEAYLLVDDQVHLGTQEAFHHYIRTVLTQAGVQDSGRIELEYDPSYQTLTWHDVQIRRGDRVINQLDAANIKVFQQERDLDWHIYNGRLSAVLFLTDVRIGDTIEYAFTVRGANPILSGRYANLFDVQWSKPLQRQYLRLCIPDGRTLFIKNFGLKTPPVSTATKEGREHVWEFKALTPLMAEDELPVWYHPYAFIQFSEFANWAEVVRWAEGLYAVPAHLSPALEQQIGRWQSGCPTAEERLLAALRFVQDDVRYLGMEIGPQSYRPEDPSVVFARRFGDCKDKSLLLCAILRRLGFEAWPMLVHTSRRQTLDQWQPSPFAFNHCIVQTAVGGAIHWLDPTRTSQRGRLKDIYRPDFRRGLLIRHDTTALTPMPVPNSGRPFLEVREIFRVSAFDKPVTMEVMTRAEGLEAEHLRNDFSSTSRVELEKTYVNYYAKDYPDIKTTAPLKFQDNPSANRIETEEHYEIGSFWALSDDKRLWLASFYAHCIQDLIAKPKQPLRTMPLGILHPRHRREVIEVHAPETWSIPAKEEVIEDKALRLRFAFSNTDRIATWTYDYETLDDAIPAANVADHVRKLTGMLDLLTRQLRCSNAAAPPLPRHIHWSYLGMAGFYLLLLLVGAILLYRYRPAFSKPPVINHPLQGLGGWLVTVILGLIASPFFCVYHIVTNTVPFTVEDWQNLTLSGNSNYHPLWAPMLTLEMLGNLTILALALLLIVLFFQKRRTFPSLYIVFQGMNIILVVVDNLGCAFIPSVAASACMNTIPTMIGAIFGGTTWIAYMLISKRVKATFVK